MSRLRDVIRDVTEDADAFDRLIANLDESTWRLPTPAPGWTIAHQVGHIAFVFRIAGLAAADPATFTTMTAQIEGRFDDVVNATAGEHVADPPEKLLARWRAERDFCMTALATLPEEQLVPWLVRPVPPVVLGSAGMMELFGHGQDIADTLGVRREYTDRLRHLVAFAVRVWDFGYQERGLAVPNVRLGFEITAPSGEVWSFGPPDATQRIIGPAVDFCLLVTRRRHRDDLALTASGSDADEWLNIAQAYRGPAGPGRTPGQFSDRQG
jgi:uncharacterized protein (TIGR03084 family)